LIDNKLPATPNGKDKMQLQQIEKLFPLLREDEKLAVTEMIRIMAKADESIE
jgi:hypothetical protein